MSQQTFEPGYFRKIPEPFSSVDAGAFPPAIFYWEDPGSGFERVDIVPHVELSNYTLLEYQGYIQLMYKSSVEVHCWPAEWTINVDEVMHWVNQHSKEM